MNDSTVNSESVPTFSFYQTNYRYLRVDYCWDRTGHGCPTLCWKLVSEVQQCCTGAPLDLTQVSCSFSRAPQSHTNYEKKAVKALCDCQLDSFDSFEPLTLFNKVFIAW